MAGRHISIDRETKNQKRVPYVCWNTLQKKKKMGLRIFA
jgi:hypothetical protein